MADDVSDEDQARIDALMEEYVALGHAVQSGVAHRLQLDAREYGLVLPDSLIRLLKHIRVGVDTSKSDMGGLATLLIEKGVFTRLEYYEAMVEAMRMEKERMEKDLSQRMGGRVSLA